MYVWYYKHRENYQRMLGCYISYLVELDRRRKGRGKAKKGLKKKTPNLYIV